MGKPFGRELIALDQTFCWAYTTSVQGLAEWVRSASCAPLLAVGSGGSFTSAAFASLLHNIFTGRMAKPVTPLELVHSPIHLPSHAVLLLSAGGSNPDVIACLDRVRFSAPEHFAVLCTRKGSPLAESAARIGEIGIHEYELPTVKDGFLATNSLLASAVLLARAYAEAWSMATTLPATLADLAYGGQNEAVFRSDLEASCRPLWERETIVVLHGFASHPAAIDLESKFTEAALGHIQTADFRNFAHGRHHWLARFGESSAVLALVTAEDQKLADRTLRLLPETIPVVRLDFGAGLVCSALAAVIAGMHITGLAGEARGVDPGRPTVPAFGRRLYHLGGLRVSPAPEPGLADEEAVAIERKAGGTVANLAVQGKLADWRKAYTTFRERLRTTAFRAIVFDYDGTLCSAAQRYTGPGSEIAGHLGDLLRGGVLVAVVTGRGKSVRNDLHQVVPERALWNRFIVGYHNGGEVGWLGDEDVPPTTTELHESLRSLAEMMRADKRLGQLTKVEAKLRQITLEFKQQGAGDEAWTLAERLVHQHATTGVTLVRSSHSIDALAPGVSKRIFVSRVREELDRLGIAGEVLCIGDKGRWPGNDFALLGEPFALSVDEVSSDPATCWNLAKPGERCSEATLSYLRSIRIDSGRFILQI